MCFNIYSIYYSSFYLLHALNIYYSGTEIDPKMDFQSICVSCSRNVQKQLKSKKEKQDLLQKGRQIITSRQLLRSRSREELSEPPSKKQLAYNEDDETTEKSKYKKVSGVGNNMK